MLCVLLFADSVHCTLIQDTPVPVNTSFHGLYKIVGIHILVEKLQIRFQELVFLPS